MEKVMYSLMTFLLLGLISFSQQVDKTTDPSCKGQSCAEAVIKKISLSEIFGDDNRFLFRTARLQSDFGNSNVTNNGGIWQIPEEDFKKTQSDVLSLNHHAIKTHFGLDWSKLTFKDCAKPLVSGLAIRILTATKTESLLTYSIAKQVEFWVENFSKKDVTQTKPLIKMLQKLENEIPCSEKMKIVIAIDASKTVGLENFEYVKQIAATIPKAFDLKSAPLGFITYSTKVNTVFDLNNNLNRDEQSKKINDIAFPWASSLTHLAINEGVKLLNAKIINSTLPASAPRILIIFTSSPPQNSYLTAKAADIARQNGVKIIAVQAGGTNTISQNDLSIIAQDNINNIIQWSTDNTADFIYRIKEKICSIPLSIPAKGEISDSVLKGETKYFAFSVPSEGRNLSVATSAKKDEGHIYFSYTFPNPSDVINDKAFPFHPINNGTNVTLVEIPKPKGPHEANIILAVRGTVNSDFTIKKFDPSSALAVQSTSAMILLSLIIAGVFKYL